MDETSPVYQNFLNKMRFSRPIRESTRRVSASKFLQRDDAASAKMSLPSTVRNIDKKITDITLLVTSISETLKAQEKLDFDILKYERERTERRRRRRRERDIEKKKKPFGIFQGTVDSITQPMKSMLDSVLGYLFNIITGKFVLGLIDFFGNPKNVDRLLSIFKFLNNNLPLIATTVGVLATTIAGILGLMAVKFIPALIASTLGMIKANPLAGLLALGSGAAITTLMNTGGGDDETMGDQPNMGEGLIPIQQFNNQSLQTNFEMSGGGKVPGGGDRDTVPAKLTPGEFVMSKGAVEKYGSNTLAAMNAAGGGTNVPILNVGGERIAFSGGGEATRGMLNIKSNPKVGNITPPIQFEMPDMNMNNMESTTLNTQTNNNVAAINNDIVIPNIHILDGDDDVKDTLGIVEAFA